jgi:dCMP deaminase
MTCENCSPELHYPGRLIQTSDDFQFCAVCGDRLLPLHKVPSKNHKEWDKYFHDVCIAISKKSPCLSRKIGAIIAKDKSIASTGYNGPPRGTPHCGHERFMKDKQLDLLAQFSTYPDEMRFDRFRTECPRRVLGYESGTHMELCPAQHAEENAISNAARFGVSVIGATVYLNSIIPCQKCMGTLINAGIGEIVVDNLKYYDKYTEFLLVNSDIEIREFDL